MKTDVLSNLAPELAVAGGFVIWGKDEGVGVNSQALARVYTANSTQEPDKNGRDQSSALVVCVK